MAANPIAGNPIAAGLWGRLGAGRWAAGVLGGIVLLAVVGPLALPDDSAQANRQQLALARLSAGSAVWLLALPDTSQAPPSLWQVWWAGRPTRPREWPLQVGGAMPRVARSGDTLMAALTATVLGAAPIRLTGAEALRAEVIQRHYLLGTDSFGRCLYSRLVLGARLTLSIGLLAMLLSLALGTWVGVLAGYWGGWLDRVLSGLMTVVWALPSLLLALALAFVLGKGWGQLVGAVALTLWVDVARLVRGEVRSLKTRGYVQAARVMGLTETRIVWRHILPALTGPLLIVGVSNFATAVLLESGLSFLGLGVPPPMPSWGAMVQEGYPYLLLDRGRGLALWPGLALFLTILSLFTLGQSLREATDPKRAPRSH